VNKKRRLIKHETVFLTINLKKSNKILILKPQELNILANQKIKI